VNPTDIILVVALVAGLAVGVFLYLRRPRVRQEPFYFCRCAICKRKFHYRRHQAGHKARCPECKHPFIFPGIPPKTPATGI
jgi:DNA-directed RNA polymerase subunit RPC12/RpoP